MSSADFIEAEKKLKLDINILTKQIIEKQALNRKAIHFSSEFTKDLNELSKTELFREQAYLKLSELDKIF